MGIQSDFQQWYGINEVEDDDNADRDLTRWDRYHCNVSLALLLVVVVVVDIDDIALLVTVETGWAVAEFVFAHYY